jgi:hypothetical protein
VEPDRRRQESSVAVPLSAPAAVSSPPTPAEADEPDSGAFAEVDEPDSGAFVEVDEPDSGAPAAAGRRRSRRTVVLIVALIVAATAVWGVHRWREITSGPTAPAGWMSWAVLDRHTGRITGSANLDATNTSESMVKAWIAADDLRRLAARDLRPDADELAALTIMVRDSDDRAAEQIYQRDGGDQVIERLVSVCGLTDTTVHPGWWSLTNISARDAVRMGGCIADGRAAGPQWTSWLLAQMRQVRGQGRFGIISALPAAQAATLAIKNGWTLHDPGNEWSVNCLAISTGWVLAVEVRYPPASGGLAHGAGICATVVRRQVLAP